jgi:ribosomal protein S18 acetylase RimI-like enzyme
MCVTRDSGSATRSVTARVVASGVVNAEEPEPALAFRDATLEDVAAVVALVESAYRGDSSRQGWTTEADLLDGQRTDIESVRSIITASVSRMLLAVDSRDQLLGCCQLERRDHGVCYFGMFAVSPVLQAGGIGRRLLAEAERIARDEWAARSMQMTVITQRKDLIAWYERRGYAITGESRPFPHGDPRFGLPRRDDLSFDVLAKPLQ